MGRRFNDQQIRFRVCRRVVKTLCQPRRHPTVAATGDEQDG